MTLGCILATIIMGCILAFYAGSSLKVAKEKKKKGKKYVFENTLGFITTISYINTAKKGDKRG